MPVGQWFQVEAFYRNTQDTTGRLTFWLDGRQIVDIANQPTAHAAGSSGTRAASARI